LDASQSNSAGCEGGSDIKPKLLGVRTSPLPMPLPNTIDDHTAVSILSFEAIHPPSSSGRLPLVISGGTHRQRTRQVGGTTRPEARIAATDVHRHILDFREEPSGGAPSCAAYCQRGSGGSLFAVYRADLRAPHARVICRRFGVFLSSSASFKFISLSLLQLALAHFDESPGRQWYTVKRVFAAFRTDVFKNMGAIKHACQAVVICLGYGIEFMVLTARATKR